MSSQLPYESVCLRRGPAARERTCPATNSIAAARESTRRAALVSALRTGLLDREADSNNATVAERCRAEDRISARSSSLMR